MGRKQKKRDKHEPARAEGKPAKIATALAAVLKDAGVTRALPQRRGPQTLPPPAPEPARLVSRPPSPPRRDMTELRMLNDAYQGAAPLRTKKLGRSSPSERSPDPPASHANEEAAARKRLAELVAGGVRFEVTREDAFVQGLAAGASRKLLSRVAGRGFAPEATLDLHGTRAAEAPRAVERFVRGSHLRGARHLLLIVGKGLHSESGTGVLGPLVSDALTQGGAAPLVLAFATAHEVHGGSGALCVLLR